MEKDRGKYLMNYSTGSVKAMGEIKTAEAIAMARKEGIKDPDLQLVEITDKGGCVVDWKPGSVTNGLREVCSKILAITY
jgi:hypothetical protein